MANQNTPWAWLGLLKWSLSYSDGTVPSEESPAPMSDEDKAFLEKVMKDGIVDEGERMKEILRHLTEYLDKVKISTEAGGSVATLEESKAEHPELEEDGAVELILELRDIVEQIDYARAFSAMGGSQFLMGCAAEREAVPRSIRSSCLGALATLCQNNPPVQSDMLNRGYIDFLADLYFKEFSPLQSGGDVDENDGIVQSRVVQALSCCIRGHAAAEKKFCASVNGRRVIESGLGVHTKGETLPEPPIPLKKRCLFFLRALVTSDTADSARVGLFEPSVRHAASHFLDAVEEPDAEIREMTLELLDVLMKQKKNISAVCEMKSELVGLGIRRIKELRGMEGEQREFASVELDQWESFIVELARAETGTLGQGNEGSAGAKDTPLLLEC
uniref:Nucleotide exchange factor Fes1 domain-containing protein n=1 Tax=Pseudictyota dubia TaxID=2749911 RepID=A0A6U2ARI9_9STRA|mmetsp:Transcript_15710/g.29771  ORF Transcript_15710/g.29771 Transcript_15710/m.29771 type:complete len:388 (+) Transcript_15710:37-1200(+)|eukprot:CAMPEP_0197460560 /NCGR_PEP_ID=MMETSP1175-20131217/54374_1 /TAXON_ID=1003142 /ORGANISM="Triceratium dubium, Strain CCMP147" /LENGTH=387 /DNA_ID=CAMNT_0042995667 /DNA_START=38 /DNA_END=1201 /DNA_ORIENTATION=-